MGVPDALCMEPLYESKLKSLPGTKSNYCYLMSDNEVGLVNYRALPCLGPCCLTNTNWKQNVPANTDCKWNQYTGRWMWWNYKQNNGGPVFQHDP